MMNGKVSSSYDNIHNNDMNCALKLSLNNE